jgi:hypothetical protein
MGGWGGGSGYLFTFASRALSTYGRRHVYVCATIVYICGHTSNQDEMAIHLILGRSPLSGECIRKEKRKKQKRHRTQRTNVIKLFN